MSLVGFAKLQGLDLPGTLGFPYAISIACSLPLEVIEALRNGPTKTYYQQYKEKNALINLVARGVEGLIRSAGYKVHVVKATVEDTGQENYIESFEGNLPHKTAATLAGLGWIGKSSLFVSSIYGPRVRLGTVLTDMPLEVGDAVSVGKCGSCMACIKACPVRAIRGGEWQVGVGRDELLDAHACRKKALEFCEGLGVRDSLCGICIWACPVGREEPA
ncbi:MAG: 4Fe-4S double cluster binding domain-containing protein [Candidatus Brocadiales bacterium]